LAQGRLEEILEEVVRFDGADAVRPLREDISLERQHHAGRVGGGIRVRHAAADGAAIAYLLVADLRDALWQQGEVALDDARPLERDVGRHRADGYGAVILADV